jgi:pimeloyl-ACP methyl ester carboxylesterase
MRQCIRGILITALCALWGCTRSGSRATPQAGPGPSPADLSVLDSVVGGSPINFRVLGASGPSVILVSGLGDGIRPWTEVQPTVATFARVLAYDRPGIGKSAPGEAPRTVSRMTDELHALAPHAGLRPPYLLVGHSLGGFIAQLYAARYPREVSGLVLVDPSIASFYVRAESLPEYRLMLGEQQRQMASAPAGVQAELRVFDQDVAEMLQAPPLLAVPAVLLTSTRHAPPGTGQPIESLWVSEHRRWAREHPGTRHVVDTLHGHYLQREAPALVIEAIRSIVMPTARDRRPKF